MPFKGDRRLGGPRRNDSTLNGTTEGPDFPPAGTILSVLSDVTYPVVFGGLEVDVSTDPNNPNLQPSQNCSVNVVADGLGGQFEDYANAYNIQYKPYGTVIFGNLGTFDLYVTVGDNSYYCGYSVSSSVHDGFGGWTYSSANYYTETGVFYSESPVDVYASFNGSSYVVGYGTRNYSHDGTGGYTTSMASVTYFYQGTIVGSGSGPYTIQLPDNNYYSVGTSSYEVVSDGAGGVYTNGTGTTYDMSGTYITNFGGNNYYSDGSGWYYSESDNSGSGSTSPTYINIGGTDYQNGTYDSSTTTTTYYPYGEYITYYDGYSYYHDGNGSYYTS